MRAARRGLTGLVMGLGFPLLSACTYYATPYPATAPYTVNSFDRSYDAALGALADQGLRITAQDRASGNIVGSNGPMSVTAMVRPQADGTTRVEFKTSGDASGNLSQRVLASYNARMGR